MKVMEPFTMCNFMTDNTVPGKLSSQQKLLTAYAEKAKDTKAILEKSIPRDMPSKCLKTGQQGTSDAIIRNLNKAIRHCMEPAGQFRVDTTALRNPQSLNDCPKHGITHRRMHEQMQEAIDTSTLSPKCLDCSTT